MWWHKPGSSKKKKHSRWSNSESRAKRGEGGDDAGL